MRADEKVDPELEREAEQDLVEELEEEVEPEQERVEDVDVSQLHFHEVAAYLEALLHGGTADLEALEHINDLERTALERITLAIQGREQGGARSILAEDRLAMLNQALAALQPVLATGFARGSLEARELFNELASDIGELQRALESLADAQEELFAQDTARMIGEAPAEEDKGKPGLLSRLLGGKPKPKAAPIDQGEVGDDRPSTLAGPGPAIEKPAAPSTLAGPGPAVDKPAPPSTLAGPGPAVDEPASPSTLSGPGPAVEKQPQPSTAWDGDERGR